MKAVPLTGSARLSIRLATLSVPTTRVLFLDNLRYLMVVLVILYHAVAAYSLVVPHWVIHDSNTLAADLIRELFDVFMMPILFFAAGYFALVSLEKKGFWEFLTDKFRRLMVPWALAALIILPPALYDQPVKPIQPFWKYWLAYLGSFQVQLRFTEAPTGVTTQAIYWFLSLLFAFFLVLALAHAGLRRWRGKAQLGPTRNTESGAARVQTLALFGGLTTAAYFVLLICVPDSSWFTLHMFLEFQVTRIVFYAGYFAFGIYVQTRGWFADGKPPGSLLLWSAIALGLGVAYYFFGQPVFADTAGTARLSAGYLLVFAFLRSFLLIVVWLVLASFGLRYWNFASRIDRHLAAASYNIYLVHFFVVIALQAALLKWLEGPVFIKIAVVFLAALGLSFAVSRWVLTRHARTFAFAVFALFAFCLVARP